MKDLFPGYYQPSEEEFKELWNECIFVFDTNILLHVYRYSEKTRERLFEIFESLQARIWIPYQVAYEYHEERLDVISHQLQPYDEIQKVLDENLDSLNKVIDKYRKRHSFTSLVDEQEIINKTKRINKKISKTLNETKNQYPNLIKNDIYRDRIKNLFLGKIGKGYSQEEEKEVHKQVKSRFEQKKPPGFEDKEKSTEAKKYGDGILWLQIIEHAKIQNKPVIFVTDDDKKDWWKIHKGQTISPRPELIQEMRLQANVSFWMYTGDRFMEYAAEYLELLKEPEVIEEAKEIRVNDNEIVRRELESRRIIKVLKEHENSLWNSKKILDEATRSIEKSIIPARQLSTLSALSAERAIKDITSKYKFNFPTLSNYDGSNFIDESNFSDED